MGADMIHRDIPDLLNNCASQVRSLIEQIETAQMRYANLEAQLRILQNDLYAAEQELNELKREKSENR